MALKPRMLKLAFTEKQPGNTIVHQFWIYPEALAALHERWPSNMMTTICSFLTSLADGSSFVVEGEYAQELAQANPPITRGRDVAGMLHVIRQQEERIANLEQQLTSGAKSVPAQAPTINAQLLAIIEALGNSGIVVPIISQGQPQPTAQPTGNLRNPDDVDYHEGDPDPNEQPPQVVDKVPAFRGLPRPIPGSTIR